MKYFAMTCLLLSSPLCMAQMPGGGPGFDPFADDEMDLTYGSVEAVSLDLTADPTKPGVWDVDATADFKAHVSAASSNAWNFPYSLSVYNGGEGIGAQPFRASGTVTVRIGGTATWSTNSSGAETVEQSRHMALAMVRGLEINGPGTTPPSRLHDTADPE